VFGFMCCMGTTDQTVHYILDESITEGFCIDNYWCYLLMFCFHKNGVLRPKHMRWVCK
jgi:hypothetical protein